MNVLGDEEQLVVRWLEQEGEDGDGRGDGD